ncbi:uncharacterized protein LAESUDRAFT_474069 [Laetiporus sulphureus 93-53]|uniref:Uncharacterized protein n=1 Tax=Laetiporus sulphureus 93-53 TaxID=1314785 RepID=A0A165GCI8_9APHY|nr:uncharacterized protein LAESUDRAFT_474069 [Laetiporus sulphureus 93-53]KZT10158.1 hypothetical protein LAESUDRAFT_474069 [Laetiporus sulphureus 93-53]
MIISSRETSLCLHKGRDKGTRSVAGFRVLLMLPAPSLLGPWVGMSCLSLLVFIRLCKEHRDRVASYGECTLCAEHTRGVAESNQECRITATELVRPFIRKSPTQIRATDSARDVLRLIAWGDIK